MASAVKTKVTELPESRVRVDAEVPAEEVERSLQRTARQLGANLRIPGFRKGKVPPPVVIRRIGRETVLDETVRDAIGRWYVDAISAADIAPVGDPKLDLGDLPAEGQPLTFTIEIGVRPEAALGTYEGVEVGRREPTVDEAQVDAEVEQLRERAARLETADRAAQRGDFVVMDYEGRIGDEPFEGGAGRDQMVELGSGRLIPGFEDQLQGAAAGEEREVKVTFPADYQAEQLAGQEATFSVSVKEVREKVLPELGDDFALEQAGFDSLEELREDIRTKLREADERRVEQDFREAVVDAVVREADVEVPDALVEARARELWDRMLHTLSHQGIGKEAYLRIAGKSEEELLEEAKPDAEQALRREAVIAAIIEKEGIAPSDGDVLDALQSSAARESTTPEKLRDRLEQAGRLDELRDDLAQRMAVDWLVEQAKSIPVEQAQARDKLWTPDKDTERQGSGRLWTPGT
ncbi:MAG: trigger factor [Actinobacteria bacterium]|nr:MAG: trigger factor [Actinomycetota bacterium]